MGMSVEYLLYPLRHISMSYLFFGEAWDSLAHHHCEWLFNVGMSVGYLLFPSRQNSKSYLFVQEAWDCLARHQCQW